MNDLWKSFWSLPPWLIAVLILLVAPTLLALVYVLVVKFFRSLLGEMFGWPSPAERNDAYEYAVKDPDRFEANMHEINGRLTNDLDKEQLEAIADVRREVARRSHVDDEGPARVKKEAP